MKRRITRNGTAAVAALALAFGPWISSGTAYAAATPTPKAPKRTFTATALTPDGTPIEAPKSKSGQLAQSDPSLLGRTDSSLVNVMVKLDYDPVATYEGDITGLAATSPDVTGKKLAKNSQAVQAYLRHVDGEQAKATKAIAAKVPAAQVSGAYQVAYGGLSMRVPANKVASLLQVPGVVAVQRDSLEHPLTDATPQFLGATAVWPTIGGSTKAGDTVIVGVLDTGIWPEHPSFRDTGLTKPDGGPWKCQFGDGADPTLGPAFTCNNKLIGAYTFTNAYMANSGALPGEYCNNGTGACSARDADGHGTHTASTAAGDRVDSAPLLGTDRGPISGIAPGAHVIAYRVCMASGCYSSDSVAAIQQAITDGVDVINFSISGGAGAYSDPVELAFLDAYAAGISVSASAGNSGPTAATSDHAGPWVTTVGASTSDRHFESTLTLTADNGQSFSKVGSTVTSGIAATAVVLAGGVPGYTGGALCLAPFAAGSVTGKVVICSRGSNARVEKGYNAMQGGAAGMILYNPVASDVETDNHWLPAIHLEGPNDAMLAFLAGHTGVTATWARGEKTTVRGDVMAGFSSRGPVGDFLKPDVTAPGVQILGGNTPTPIEITAGPPGQLFQAIAGTSMSSPHSAGVSALVKAVHPDWTPGQIKSALMTSSVQDVLKEDGVTPADPWDRGAGSIRANRAVAAMVTFDVPAAAYYASATDPLHRINLNVPSINANPMPGSVVTTRTAKNVSGKTQVFKVTAKADGGTKITVSPAQFSLAAGKSQKLTITIDGATVADGWHFGQITVASSNAKDVAAVLPVALNKTQGAVTLDHTCTPTDVARSAASHCTVTVTNQAPVEASASLKVTAPAQVDLSNVSVPFAGKCDRYRGILRLLCMLLTKNTTSISWNGDLTPALAPTVDAITAAQGNSPAGGYLPLSAFGIAPTSGFGDETVANFNVPSFTYGSETYSRIGVLSNGYVVVGGATSDDNNFEPQTFPNAARPNNVLAPFWSDLSLDPASGGGSVRVGTLTDGVDTWLVVDWDKVKPWSANPATAPTNSFQIWMQLGTTDGIWFAYGAMGGSPNTTNVGAENRDGSSGVNLPVSSLTTSPDWAITTSPPQPGGVAVITYDAMSRLKGSYDLSAKLTTPLVNGTTTENVRLTVR